MSIMHRRRRSSLLPVRNVALRAHAHDKGATVQLRGPYPIAMGNHVKATGKVNSIALGNPAKGTIMGNVATGDYIQLGGAIPAPATNFNVVL